VIVLNSLFPIMALLLFGNLLKRGGYTDSVFLQTVDRLIYNFFFPVMLFWKIGAASLAKGIDWNFCLASLCSLTALFVLSLLLIRPFAISNFQAGSFSQSCYRFNTYIGVAVILNSLGAEGVKYFGILLGFAIPLCNLFAVTALIWFSGQEVALPRRVRMLGMALISNPLILGCLAGIVYARICTGFPVFVDNTFSLVSMATLPMALISVGGVLSFAGVKENLGVSLLASALKLVALPGLGLVFYSLFHVTGLPFKAGMLFLCLPTSTLIYVLSSQMNSDTRLASSIIAVSTLLSFIPLSLALLI
jgi:predicted permease